jgi:uncharacterized membrane protein
MDFMSVLEGLFRWLHVVAGILWIGLLYFFNWVNANFAPTMDAETKRKVVPELMPRALFWFRWAAAFTWVTGLLLLLIVFYHGGLALAPDAHWSIWSVFGVMLVFAAPFVYDPLFAALKSPQAEFGVGLILSLALLGVFQLVGFGFRGYAIHLGGTFGTVMAFNVWMRIWPAQKRIITAIKAGQAPDPKDVALAGTRSRHNTYMSVPLVFMMLNQHMTWAANPIWIGLVVLAGWGLVQHMYVQAKKVPGF